MILCLEFGLLDFLGLVGHLLLSIVCKISPFVPRVESSETLRCPMTGAAIFYGRRKSVCMGFAYARHF